MQRRRWGWTESRIMGKAEKKTFNVQEWKKDQKRLTRTRCKGEGNWESALQCWNSGTDFRWSITLIDFRLITTEIFAPLYKVMMLKARCSDVCITAKWWTFNYRSNNVHHVISNWQVHIKEGIYSPVIFKDNLADRTTPPFTKKKRALPPKTFQNRWNRSDASLEKKCWWWQGVEAHILGLDGIQVEGIHSTGTGTKLLAVLVWLSNQTTHSCAR